MKPKGMTLIEILVASVIFIMISASFLSVFRTTMREFRFKSMVSDAIKENSIGLANMSKEITGAEMVCCPDSAAKTELMVNSDSLEAGFSPASMSRCMAFKIRVPKETDPAQTELRVIGYYLDAASAKIKRVKFDLSANEQSATWVASNPNQISEIANIGVNDGFAYKNFTFKFDRAYRAVAGHSISSPDNHYTQVLAIGMSLKRQAGSAPSASVDYPFMTKIWLERNAGIYP